MKFTDFKIIKSCTFTRARVSVYKLSKKVKLPVFMPVATYGAMWAIGFKSSVLKKYKIILSNTYHCRFLERDYAIKSLKAFNGWENNLLTDSGGFQIQSLPNDIIEQGVLFKDKGKSLFTVEDSMKIQLGLGPDIFMQLDHVVNPLKDHEEHSIATERSIRWLDRGIKCVEKYNEDKSNEDKSNEDNNSYNNNSDNIKDINNIKDTINNNNKDTFINNKDIKDTTINNNINNNIKDTNIKDIKDINNIKLNPILYNNSYHILFPIIQGGLFEDLRLSSIKSILLRQPKGLAVGGMCGGEDKRDFCRIVNFTIKTLRLLNYTGPVYTMGVGYPDDLVLIVAYGSDMSDCVYPTRTARIGRIFTDNGDIEINNKILKSKNKEKPLHSKTKCKCLCCGYSPLYLLSIKNTSNFCMLTTLHNLQYLSNLYKRIRKSILKGKYKEFILEYYSKRYKEVPEWIKYGLKLINIEI